MIVAPPLSSTACDAGIFALHCFSLLSLLRFADALTLSDLGGNRSLRCNCNMILATGNLAVTRPVHPSFAPKRLEL